MSYKLLGKANQTYQTRGNSYAADSYGLITVALPNFWDIADLTNAGCISLGQTQALNNLTAAADPAAGNDNTQDYGPGSLWVNTANGRVWICQSASTGAAAWAVAVVPGVGADPASMLTAFGSGTGTFTEEGNINRQIAATPGTTNGNNADTTDDVLFSYALPANSFDQALRGLNISAAGKLANTANNKRVKLWWNATIVSGAVTAGTLIADTGALTTANQNVGFFLTGNVFKYGAANSNTQYVQGSPIWGTTHGGISLPVLATATENAAITIAVTGSSYTTGGAGDVLGYWFEVNAMN